MSKKSVVLYLLALYSVEPYYTDQALVLKILKRLKPARMKKFSSSAEAEEFNTTFEAVALPFEQVTV